MTKRCPVGDYYGCPDVDNCRVHDKLQSDIESLGPDLARIAIWAETGRLLEISDKGDVTGCVRLRPEKE